MGDLLDTVAPEAGDGAGLSSVPGTDEAAAVQQLLRFMDDDRFDRVVVDTAPTGHTLRLLELPDVMDSMVGRALKLRQTLGGVMDRVGGLFGGDDGIEGDDAVEGGLSAEEADDLEALQERIERLRGTLRDPARTDFRIVMVPEEMSVLESERLRDRLDAFGIPVGMVVVNRVMEDLADVADIAGEFVSPNLEDCAFCARRWEVQQDALAAAQDLFREYRVARVPLFAEEVRGKKRLRLVAACLAA
jgi:arsenite-transporting ATPase